MLRLVELYFNHSNDAKVIEEVVFYLKTNLDILKKTKTLDKELIITVLLIERINKLCPDNKITLLLETIKDYFFFTCLGNTPLQAHDNDITSFLRKSYLDQLSTAYSGESAARH